MTVRLPFTLDPHEGQDFVAWLRAYAARLDVTPAELADALGLPDHLYEPRTRHRGCLLGGYHVESVAAATGLSTTAIGAMCSAIPPATQTSRGLGVPRIWRWIAEGMLYKRWRKEWKVRSLALRDQLRERGVPNHRKGRPSRAGVLSVAGKRQGNPGQVCTTELSESEPSDDASKGLDDIRTRGARLSWDQSGRWFSFLARRCPVYRGQERGAGSCTELGNQSCRCPPGWGNGSTPRPKAEGESTGCGALGRIRAL